MVSHVCSLFKPRVCRPGDPPPFVVFMYQTRNLSLSHTHTHTNSHSLTLTQKEYTQIVAFSPSIYKLSVSQSHTGGVRSVIKVYCCPAIEAPPTLHCLHPPFLLGQPFSSLFVPLYSSLPPASFFLLLSWSFPLLLLPSPPPSLCSPSLADESRDQLRPLKWLRRAHSHWFSCRSRGAEVLGERAGDERSYEGRGGGK